eukprot:4108237-Prymnesium_polylepis.2
MSRNASIVSFASSGGSCVEPLALFGSCVEPPPPPPAVPPSTAEVAPPPPCRMRESNRRLNGPLHSATCHMQTCRHARTTASATASASASATASASGTWMCKCKCKWHVYVACGMCMWHVHVVHVVTVQRSRGGSTCVWRTLLSDAASACLMRSCARLPPRHSSSSCQIRQGGACRIRQECVCSSSCQIRQGGRAGLGRSACARAAVRSKHGWSVSQLGGVRGTARVQVRRRAWDECEEVSRSLGPKRNPGSSRALCAVRAVAQRERLRKGRAVRAAECERARAWSAAARALTMYSSMCPVIRAHQGTHQGSSGLTMYSSMCPVDCESRRQWPAPRL